MNRSPLRSKAGLALIGLLCGSLHAFAGSMAAPSVEAPVALVPLVTKGLEKPLFLTHAGDGS
ncbi:MAG TPA: hypothetical protein VLS44_02590, partial [Nitrospira sp.]|nr:hypothetical protein [Nitrospira sp.]